MRKSIVTLWSVKPHLGEKRIVVSVSSDHAIELHGSLLRVIGRASMFLRWRQQISVSRDSNKRRN